MEYEVLSRIWHTSDARYYEAGAMVTLNHLTPEEIEILVRGGVVAPAQMSEISASEETHGTDDSGNVL